MKKHLQFAILLLLIGCKPVTKDNNNFAQVDQNTIGKHIERLASDEFMGRKPFTEGEVKTVNYLKDEFLKLGLEPGNGESYFQDVPMVEINGTPSEKMMISSTKGDFDLKYFEDFVATTQKTAPEINLDNSELVFAGYGIVAPEYNWNEYEGGDWKGKTAIILLNDPGFKSGDSTLFRGNSLTYYGRHTYKVEEAARQGASGAILVHETEAASVDWSVIQTAMSGAKLTLESSRPNLDVKAFITTESANRLFEASVLENKNYKDIARTKGFKPIALGLNVTMSISNKIKRDISKNVVALIPGKSRKDEFIIYSAHWDHLGIGKPVDNDSIYNGAVDNASGTACLLAIAEAFKKGKQTKRSIVFIAVTAEEQGLLGSAYYAENPIYSPTKTVANINMDALTSPGRMKDLTIIGFGQSEMDEYAKAAAEIQGRYIMKDPEPEKGRFFRSDHFNFAKIGIPALWAKGFYEGFDISIDNIKKMNDDYYSNKYHKPSDEYNLETIELSGVQLDAQLFYHVGIKLSNEEYFPKWYDQSEFKIARKSK